MPVAAALVYLVCRQMAVSERRSSIILAGCLAGSTTTSVAVSGIVADVAGLVATVVALAHRSLAG